MLKSSHRFRVPAGSESRGQHAFEMDESGLPNCTGIKLMVLSVKTANTTAPASKAQQLVVGE